MCFRVLRLVYEGEKTPSYTYGDFQTAGVVQMATNGDKTLFWPHLEGKYEQSMDYVEPKVNIWRRRRSGHLKEKVLKKVC